MWRFMGSIEKMNRNIKRVILGFLILTSGCLQSPAKKPDAAVFQENVVKDPTEVPPPIYPRTTPTIMSVDLVAQELMAELAPGKKFLFWTFAEPGKNATVPGPMIRVMEGDTLIINLTNARTNVKQHNIDFH